MTTTGGFPGCSCALFLLVLAVVLLLAFPFWRSYVEAAWFVFNAVDATCKLSGGGGGGIFGSGGGQDFGKDRAACFSLLGLKSWRAVPCKVDLELSAKTEKITEKTRTWLTFPVENDPACGGDGSADESSCDNLFGSYQKVSGGFDCLIFGKGACLSG